MAFGILILAVALIISLSSAVYSILGLTAIFAAAFWPIVVMGGALELGKIVTTLWLHKYWHKAELQYKVYLSFAVAVLMALTSMGVFGFLSKAHTDQALVSGDVGAKIAVYDEKIRISKDNIDANRKALAQMDSAVDQTMSRSNDEKGADKAVAIRRSQSAERTRLLKEIDQEQKKITALNEEAAPIRAEVRKVEAEVGPIKYIAALIYGDNPDGNLLESAVRWVIILIVIVFDPLALTLLLAATKTFEWERGIDVFNLKRKEEEEQAQLDIEIADANAQAAELNQDLDIIEAEIQAHNSLEEQDQKERAKLERERNRLAKKLEGLQQELEAAEQVKEQLKQAKQEIKTTSAELTSAQAQAAKLQRAADRATKSKEAVELELNETKKALESERNRNPLALTERPGDYIEPPVVETPEEHIVELVDDNGDYLRVDGKTYSKDTFNKTFPELRLEADNAIKQNIITDVTFGTSFPTRANKGDTFLRVDIKPNRLYKFNGRTWIEIDKSASDAYAYDEEYIKHLVEKLGTGEYDLEDLSPVEQDQVEKMLNQLKGKNG